MIKNKEEIEQKLINEMTKRVKEYVKEMDEKSDGEFYPIDVIEADLVRFQQESVKMIKETTEELLNSIDEEKEIKKNKKSAKKN